MLTALGYPEAEQDWTNARAMVGAMQIVRIARELEAIRKALTQAK